MHWQSAALKFLELAEVNTPFDKLLAVQSMYHHITLTQVRNIVLNRSFFLRALASTALSPRFKY